MGGAEQEGWGRKGGGGGGGGGLSHAVQELCNFLAAFQIWASEAWRAEQTYWDKDGRCVAHNLALYRMVGRHLSTGISLLCCTLFYFLLALCFSSHPCVVSADCVCALLNIKATVHCRACSVVLRCSVCVIVRKACVLLKQEHWLSRQEIRAFLALVQDWENGGPALLSRVTLQNDGAVCVRNTLPSFSFFFFFLPLALFCTLSPLSVVASIKVSLKTSWCTHPITSLLLLWQSVYLHTNYARMWGCM